MPFYKLILNYSIRYVNIFKQHGDLAQLGEHFLDVEGVMGSSPLALTIQYTNRINMRFFCAFTTINHVKMQSLAPQDVIPLLSGMRNVHFKYRIIF